MFQNNLNIHILSTIYSVNDWLNVSKNVATISPCPALNIFRVYATIPHIYKYIRKQRYSGNYPEIQNWNFCEKSEKGLITAWDFSQKFTKKIHTVKFCVVILNLFLLLDYYSTSSIAEVFLLQQIFIINIRRKLNSSYRTDTSIFIFIQIFILFVSHNEIQLGFLCFHLFCFKE